MKASAAAKETAEFHHRMPDGALVFCDGSRDGSTARKNTHRNKQPMTTGLCSKWQRCANYKIGKCFKECPDFIEKQTATLVY